MPWAVTDSITVRAEGLYYFFDESESDFTSPILPSSGNTDDFAELDNIFVLRVGATFMFDSFLSGNTRKTAANRHRPDAVASKMAPAKVSQAQPLARAPKPRTEVVAPAPPREPLRTVVSASTGLDIESRLGKPKKLYDQGPITDKAYYETRKQLLPGMSAAKDDLKAAAVQVGPEKKPGQPEPSVKPDDEVVKVVFATPGTRGGEADRGSREYILWVQRSLNQLLGTRLGVDGVMGRRTHNAVRSFQRQAGIGVDGIVGPQTEDALIKAAASLQRAGLG